MDNRLKRLSRRNSKTHLHKAIIHNFRGSTLAIFSHFHQAYDLSHESITPEMWN